MGDEEAELERREAALAATPILQPDFKSSKITQAQLDKFKELHTRRLQLKGKPKDKRKKGKGCHVIELGCKNKLANDTIEASNLSTAKGKGISDNEASASTPIKKKKLNWGLEAKERWERKANM